MKKLFLLPFLLIFLTSIVYSAGEFGEGTFGEGEFDFGTPAVATASSDGGGGGSGGGSGGGGGGKAVDGFSKGSRTTQLNYGDAFIFHINNQRHTAVILKVQSYSINLRISSAFKDFTIELGESVSLDVDNNGLNDLQVRLDKISKLGGTFTFIILDEIKPSIVSEVKVIEQIPDAEETEGLNIVEEPNEIVVATPEEPAQEPKKSSKTIETLVVIIIFSVVGFLGALVYHKSKKQPKKELKQQEDNKKEDKLC